MAAPVARDAAKTARTGTANGGGSTGQGKTVDDVKEQLYTTFNEALEKTKAEVKQMQDKLKDYDEKFQATETMKQQGQKATDYLNATLEEIKTNLDSLTEKARGVFLEAKDLATETVTDIWKSLNESIEKLRNLAIEFDSKYHLSQTMSELTAPVLEKLKAFGGSFDQAMDTLKDAGLTGRKYIIGTAASLEHKYQIESKLNGLDEKFKITENVKNIQAKGEEFVEKQHIKERVKQFDERFTGSKATTYIEEGVKLVQTKLEEMQKDYATAKDKGTAKKAL